MPAHKKYLEDSITIMLNMQNIYYPANLNADGVHLSPHQYYRHKKKHVNDHSQKYEENVRCILKYECYPLLSSCDNAQKYFLKRNFEN